MSWSDVAAIQTYDVGDRDLSWRADARLRFTEVLSTDVVGESCFSSLTIINAASRAFAVGTVLDKPYGGVAEPAVPIVLGISQPELRPLAPTRRCSLIRSMSPNVV